MIEVVRTGDSLEDGAYYGSLVEHPKPNYLLWEANYGFVHARSRPGLNHIKGSCSLLEGHKQSAS